MKRARFEAAVWEHLSSSVGIIKLLREKNIYIKDSLNLSRGCYLEDNCALRPFAQKQTSHSRPSFAALTLVQIEEHSVRC